MIFLNQIKKYMIIKRGLIYLVIANFIGNYTDTFQIFYSYECYDISQIQIYKKEFEIHKTNWVSFLLFY